MANTFQIKRGTGIPPDGTLADGELGYNKTNGSLYIGVSSNDGTKSLPIGFSLEKLTPNLTENNKNYYIYKGNIVPESTTDKDTAITNGNYWLKTNSKSFLILTIGSNRRISSGWSGSIYYNSFIIPLVDTGITHHCFFSVLSEDLQGEIKIRTKYKTGDKYVGCFDINIKKAGTKITLAEENNANPAVGTYRFELKAYAI